MRGDRATGPRQSALRALNLFTTSGVEPFALATSRTAPSPSPSMSKTCWRRCLLPVLLLTMMAAAPRLRAQQPVAAAAAQADTSDPTALKVFLDCRGDTSRGCETDFFVLDMPFVSWTRDRLFADVQFLVTTIQTGSGSFTYTVTALGRGRYAGRADTSVVTTIPNEAEDPIRRKLSKAFTFLLLPYIRGTPAAERFTIRYNAPAGAKQATPASVKDPWNFFVLSVEANGFLNGESLQSSANFFSNVRVRRTTESSSMRFGIFQDMQYSKFRTTDSTTVTNTVRSATGFARAVKALDKRWSAGVATNLGYSEFNNTALVWRAAPIVEFNVFPWSQATSRQVALSYGIGPRFFRWREPTIFGRSSEWRVQQELVLGTDVRQSWGNIRVSTRYASYLPEASKWNLGLNGEVSLNVVKGLNVNVGGGASVIRDQIFLAARGRTPEQILLRQRALASNYSYFVYGGLSYSFGSIYNSVVNPRLDFFNLGGNN
jgi:hypothetical protein